MLYLLDANVLIDANRDYYPMDRVPEFWGWLEHCGENKRIAIGLEIYEEFKSYKDDLGKWARKEDVRSALVLAEEAEPSVVARVVSEGYAPDLSDEELEKLGRDPFLIGYALRDLGNRTVVTTESKRPSRTRANRHVPDVCERLGIPWCTPFEMLRALNFTTDWSSRVGSGQR